MPLKSITGVKTNEEKPKSKSDIPIIHVEGDLIKRYNDTKKTMDEAEAALKEMRPTVLDDALPAIYAHNCDPNCLKPISSVKLEDDEGELACVQCQNSYSAVDPEPVEALFEKLGVDINEYVAEKLVAKFDSSVFTDGDGNFDKKIYEKFRVAIEKAAFELKLRNTDGTLRNPLSTARVVMPRPTFHERRFKDFPEGRQADLSEVLPNKCLIKPERTK